MNRRRLVRRTVCLTLIAMLALAGDAPAAEPMRYLAFQIFTRDPESVPMQRAFPPPPGELLETVAGIRSRIGLAGNGARRLGVVFGPLALDDSDQRVRDLIAQGFDIALKTGVAVGFHVDDSMFWGRLKSLNAPQSVEWLDWRGTLNTGRRLDWSAQPIKIMPQLCLNSHAVRETVARRARLIGNEVAKGVARLHAAHRDELFLGVIAGWETQIGRDFDSGKYLGYCALTNAGYSAAHPPADMDLELTKIVRDFAGFWTGSLIAAGVPAGKVFSHIAFQSRTVYRMHALGNPADASVPYVREVNFTPPSVAFCDRCIPGISTYPQPGHLEQWQDELRVHGDPPWASCEGTALDPGMAGHSGANGAGAYMEAYLGNLFNHGAVLVNVFGWGVGDEGNPFRSVAESDAALSAYRKFLSGGTLREGRPPNPSMPPDDLPAKVHRIQALVPNWISQHGPAQIEGDMQTLEAALREKRFDDAERAANALLKTMSP